VRATEPRGAPLRTTGMDTPGARRGPALVTRDRDLGLRRRSVVTPLGRVVVRAGRATGSATATILLHGAAGSWTTWTPLIVASDRTPAPLADLVIPDLPGWGESGALPAEAGVAAMSDAVAAVARGLGYTSWRVVGHSLGGFLALDLAARHPRETASATLVSPSGAAVVDAVRRPLRGGIRLPAFAGMLATMRALAALGPVGRVLAPALHRVGALRPLAAPLFARPRAVHRSVVAALAHEVRPASFARAARHASGYDLDAWRRITCPVEAVRGEADVFAGATDAAAFGARIGGFHEIVLDDAGHFAHIERPDAVLAALERARATRSAARR
jgi:pimeloyl-ACP methyl ester carboxylesterase